MKILLTVISFLSISTFANSLENSSEVSLICHYSGSSRDIDIMKGAITVKLNRDKDSAQSSISYMFSNGNEAEVSLSLSRRTNNSHSLKAHFKVNYDESLYSRDKSVLFNTPSKNQIGRKRGVYSQNFSQSIQESFSVTCELPARN
jgi:hypothetical protein